MLGFNYLARSPVFIVMGTVFFTDTLDKVERIPEKGKVLRIYYGTPLISPTSHQPYYRV